jgi:hypothetical protein
VAAASTYIGHFFSGGVPESTPHVVLILLAVAGGAAVGAGIIWEAKRGGHLWTLPTALVFLGVVVEAAATVILLEFDEGISRDQQATIGAQQSKIIALERGLKIAEMNLSDRVVSGDMLGPFGPMGSDSGGHVGQSLHILVVEHDDEAERFADSIRDVLHNVYGWNVTISPLEEGSSIWNPNFLDLPQLEWAGSRQGFLGHLVEMIRM